MKAFFDTNILIYATMHNPKQVVARRVISGGGLISAQVLNEFANVAHRKLKISWLDTRSALTALRSALPPVLQITVATHEAALTLAEQHDFPFYDALIVASALEARCATLYTEDMHHGMTVRGSLQIVNPFVALPGNAPS